MIIDEAKKVLQKNFNIPIFTLKKLTLNREKVKGLIRIYFYFRHNSCGHIWIGWTVDILWGDNCPHLDTKYHSTNILRKME